MVDIWLQLFGRQIWLDLCWQAKLCSFWMELAYIKLLWSSDSTKASGKKHTVCKEAIEHNFGELSQRNQGYFLSM